MSDLGGERPEFLRAPTEGRRLTLDEARGIQLVPGDMITGLRDTRAYNQLEAQAALQLDPSFDLEGAVFAGKPLATQLRPKGFEGDLIGVALAVPSDMDVLNAKYGRKNPIRPEHTLSLLIEADMHATGHGIQGRVSRGVTYFLRNRTTAKNYKNYGLVGRYLGPSNEVDAAEKTATNLRLSAEERAREVAAIGMQNVFSAGAPGQKRRK